MTRPAGFAIALVADDEAKMHEIEREAAQAGYILVTDGKVINIEDCQSYSIDARVSEDGKTLRVRHWTGFGRTWTLVR